MNVEAVDVDGEDSLAVVDCSETIDDPRSDSRCRRLCRLCSFLLFSVSILLWEEGGCSSPDSQRCRITC